MIRVWFGTTSAILNENAIEVKSYVVLWINNDLTERSSHYRDRKNRNKRKMLASSWYLPDVNKLERYSFWYKYVDFYKLCRVHLVVLLSTIISDD